MAASTRTDQPSFTTRGLVELAIKAIPFLRVQKETKTLEFWDTWFRAVPQHGPDVQQLYSTNFYISTTANMEKISWRAVGNQNLFIQPLVDFFWNVGAPESEIDRLNEIGEYLNPILIGSWIEMSSLSGMDGGWVFPVITTVEMALRAGDPGEAVNQLVEWTEKNNVINSIRVGRDMGAAPPRQTEVWLTLPGNTFQEQLTLGLKAWTDFSVPLPPPEVIEIISTTPSAPELILTVILSSEGFVRLGLLFPHPRVDTVLELCEQVKGNSDDLAFFEGCLALDGPTHVEFAHLMKGFGYGVYKEGFDIVFHYHIGEEKSG